MTQRELQKLITINKVIDGTLAVKEAAQVLDLSPRQIFRLKKGVKEQGESFVIHKNKGRKPANAIPEDVVHNVIHLKQNKYYDANFSHFRDLLEEREGIKLSQPSVYRILTNAGIQSPKKHRKKSKSHKSRERMPQAGLLVQIDCSAHEWIPSMGPLALHGAIDDAAGLGLGAYLTYTECAEGYFEVIRQIINQYGVPLSLYSDRHTIFVSLLKRISSPLRNS